MAAMKARENYEAARTCCWILLAWAAGARVCQKRCVVELARSPRAGLLGFRARYPVRAGLLPRDVTPDRKSVGAALSCLRRETWPTNRLGALAEVAARVERPLLDAICGSAAVKLSVASKPFGSRTDASRLNVCGLGAARSGGCGNVWRGNRPQALPVSETRVTDLLRDMLSAIATEKLSAVPNNRLGTRTEHSIPDSFCVGAICRVAANNEVCAATYLVDDSTAQEPKGLELLERVSLYRCFTWVGGTGAAVRDVSLTVRCARCSSFRRVAPALSEAASKHGDVAASPKGKVSCPPTRDSFAEARDGSRSLDRNCGVQGASSLDSGMEVPPDGGNVGTSVELSESNSGRCSESEGRSEPSERQQSRIQRANLASTSASAHLSRSSWASLRIRARRFRCASSNDSRAGLEAVMRKFSCGWVDAMTNPPYSGPQREGGTRHSVSERLGTAVLVIQRFCGMQVGMHGGLKKVSAKRFLGRGFKMDIERPECGHRLNEK